MSNFYIGQRVRIRYSIRWPEFGGQETWITGPLQEWPHGITGQLYLAYSVAIHKNFGPTPDQLEPILPDGLESIEDINALYEPSPNEVLANVGMRMEWQR